MPIHFEDCDIRSDVTGLRSALIVPCHMCPAVTVAVRDGKPFLRLFRSLLKSAPFERYLDDLRNRLSEIGVGTEVFRSRLWHQWFLCMWTARQREKLRDSAARHEAVIVLGCESATETVRGTVASNDCRVIEGMRVSGVMNAKLRFRAPDKITFEDCRVVPISRA